MAVLVFPPSPLPAVVWQLDYHNLTVQSQRFFRATALSRIEKDARVASLSYAINGAAAVAVPFAGNVYAPTTPLALPAGALVVWTIAYAAGNTAGVVELQGTETV